LTVQLHQIGVRNLTGQHIVALRQSGFTRHNRHPDTVGRIDDADQHELMAFLQVAGQPGIGFQHARKVLVRVHRSDEQHEGPRDAQPFHQRSGGVVPRLGRIGRPEFGIGRRIYGPDTVAAEVEQLERFSR